MKGEFALGGRRVDLAQVTMPVLNVYALEDHIIPPGCSKALGGVVGSKDYTEIPLPGGHVGVFVSGKSQALFCARRGHLASQPRRSSGQRRRRGGPRQ